MTYALITPARNEAASIERTIISVVRQTVKPTKWLVVSDGSTDGTDDIVENLAKNTAWIQLLRMPERTDRHFGGKAVAFNTGFESLRRHRYDFLGNLDADIVLGPDHFEYLLDKFARDKTLGVAGTPFKEGNRQYDYRFSRKEHVSGACQLFRRECFEEIGGYLPLKGGGIDLVAVVTARMRGWRTETFTERASLHLRPMGKAGPHYLKYNWKSGYGDYLLGVHPLWQFFRSVYQMRSNPPVLTGMLLLAGFLWGMITIAPKPVSNEFVRFRRSEQLRWLKDYHRKAIEKLI